MHIHSLISSSIQVVSAHAISALADTHLDSSEQDVLRQVVNKIHEVERLIADGTLPTEPGPNAMKPAVFTAKRTDGSIHVGWHHAKLEAVAGERFHYDHGTGIERNEDGQYIWFAPITAYVNFTYNSERDSFDGAWESCHVDTNTTSCHNVYHRLIIKALEPKIDTRPKIVYLTLSNPVDSKKAIEVRRFELGYPS